MLLKCLHIFGNAYCVRERTKFCIGNFIISRLYTVCIIHSRVSVCVFQSENKTDIVHNQHAIYHITNFLVNLFHPLNVLLLCMVVKWGGGGSGDNISHLRLDHNLFMHTYYTCGGRASTRHSLHNTHFYIYNPTLAFDTMNEKSS